MLRCPRIPGQFTPLQSTLNNYASGWGIQSQNDVNNTVFVVLYAPNLSSCPDASVNGETGPGGPGLYGNFVYANVHLVDLNNVGSCTPPPLNNVTAVQFATFATSHEVDEAITAPQTHGWILPGGPSDKGGQIADPCNTRDISGNVIWSTGPYWNFTTDSRGTVVAPYVSYLTNKCYPYVSSSVPPA